MGKKSKNAEKNTKKNNDGSSNNNNKNNNRRQEQTVMSARAWATFERAEAAAERGEYKKAADDYMELYRIEVHNPSSVFWYSAFHNVTCMFDRVNEKNEKGGYKKAIKVMENLADCDAEPPLIRTVAARSAAKLHGRSNFNMQLCAEMHRQAIAICNMATVEEKSRVVMDLDNEVKPVREIMSKLKEKSSSFLTVVTKTPPLTLVPTYSGRALQAGGDSCDACGKTREQLGVTHMNCCKRCGMTYYCSIECQRKQWKVGGHKLACRKPGQIEVGDVMLLFGLESRPDLNGQPVRIIGPAAVSSNDNNKHNNNNNTQNRLKVEFCERSDPCISVAADKLIRIRPAA